MPDSPPSSSLSIGFGTPFEEQIGYLKNKLGLPTDRWDDIMRSAHDRAFVVAGAAKADLLQDLQNAVIAGASEGGGGLRGFQKDFQQIVAKHGWTGWTGQGTKKGEAWRARVIYQTNMSTSYWAGQWQQMTSKDALAANPYWRYLHADGVPHPRPEHLEWHGLTLLASHPFWQTHFPPNGWFCHCRVTGVSKTEGERSAKAHLGQPPADWNNIDESTGDPVGIDKGWGYAPGANSRAELQQFIDQKLINLNAATGSRMWADVQSILQAERQAQWQKFFDRTQSKLQAVTAKERIGTPIPPEFLKPTETTIVQVHTIAPNIVDALAEREIALENATILMRDSDITHAIRPSKIAGERALPTDIWRNLPSILPDATVYLDTLDKTLLYVIDLGKQLGKIAVRVNYSGKGTIDSNPVAVKSNFVVTGGLVLPIDIKNDLRYVQLGNRSEAAPDSNRIIATDFSEPNPSLGNYRLNPNSTHYRANPEPTPNQRQGLPCSTPPSP